MTEHFRPLSRVVLCAGTLGDGTWVSDVVPYGGLTVTVTVTGKGRSDTPSADANLIYCTGIVIYGTALPVGASLPPAWLVCLAWLVFVRGKAAEIFVGRNARCFPADASICYIIIYGATSGASSCFRFHAANV